VTADLCQKRSRDGTKCELPDAEYGVTLRFSPHAFYTVMSCKKHFEQYLRDPAEYQEEHEQGTLNFLTGMRG
jgi:hypothetical protein